MRININAHLIIIEILDEICAREQTWSSVEYSEYCFKNAVDHGPWHGR